MSTAPRVRQIAVSVTLLVLSLLAFEAPPATAAFHEILVREVYAGGPANDSYVVLQAYRGGQNFLSGHSVSAYDSAGSEVGSFTFSSGVSNGQDQMTILVADTSYAATFPGGPAPDGTTANLDLDPAGGAACWAGLDCVSWGDFSGTTSPPAGPSAAPTGISPGMALRRTIAPGCATLLEATDDHDNSAVDFSAVFPSPRANSTAPSERACDSSSSPGSQQSGPGARGAPQTTFKGKPPHKTRDRTPTFRFTSDEASSTFQCKLDGKPFRACRSPFTTKRLAPGKHTFRVRARDESGQLDPTPAAYAFRIAIKVR